MKIIIKMSEGLIDSIESSDTCEIIVETTDKFGKKTESVSLWTPEVSPDVPQRFEQFKKLFLIAKGD